MQLDGQALARYVAKLQEGTAIRLHTAHELTRSDLKRGREGSLMPFDLIAKFFATGDMDLLDLWHEYEQETVYKSVIRFTKGLRCHLGLTETEPTDEEVAAKKVGGTDVIRFAGWFYRRIARVPGLEGNTNSRWERPITGGRRRKEEATRPGEATCISALPRLSGRVKRS